MKKTIAVQVLGVVAACICMSCSSGVLDLNDVDIGTFGDVLFGDADIGAYVDLPGETAAPECETHQDCEGKFADLNVCEIAQCDAATKMCVKGARKNYSPCEAGGACTYDDYCLEGVCGNGQQHECTDGNPCTDDSCIPETGCQFTNNTIPCDDGNECTANDACSAGICFGQPQECPCESNLDCQIVGEDLCSYDEMDCVDGFCAPTGSVDVLCDDSQDTQCLLTLCNPETGSCEQAEIDGVCSDGSTCTVGDTCQAGQCLPGANMCDCQADMDCVGFEDGDLCNGTLACIDSACAVDPATVVTCSSAGLGQCEASQCNSATGACEVSTKLDGVACDDGDPCTDTDVCVNGQCFGSAGSCDDGNPCTEDSCDEAGGCVNAPLSDVPCEDGDECTGEGLCVEGECIGGENVCGDCGNDICEDGESCGSCPDDCGLCGDCCAIQEGPGCEDEAVETCTCELDSYCCETAWDELCIEQAVADCDLVCEVQGCGDAVCDETESCESCPEDCGECMAGCCEPSDAPGCVDGEIQVCVCALDAFCCESSWDDICVAEVEEYGCGDCGGVGGCGDGFCIEPEACFDCPEDCGECSVCGDFECDPLESCELCPEDCGECGFCGDDACGDEEDCKSCPEDCGDCCGNDSCEALFGEYCDTCPEDCGDCPTECGDEVCDEDEDCANCAADCGECEGSCCIANGTPGCMDPLVQGCVCAVDPFCCESEWDAECAAAADECGSCNGDCCESHPAPGCLDGGDIEDCVCTEDPFCCEVAWDGLCVAEVVDLGCGVCEVVAECGDNECHGEEDCKSCPADCGECCGNDSCEALLGEDCLTCPADCGDCPATCDDGVCDDNETCVNCPTDCGDCHGSCCLPNGTEGCIDANVQGCVCAQDPFCCNVQWDGLCASEADECGSCDGDCCATNGNAGCEDESIESCVCADDPYCCNINWDNLCVNEVESLECGICVVADVCGDGICGETETCESCPNDCGECEGGCCSAHDDVGCTDPECAEFICGMDPYCCENSWDNQCAEEALQYCPVCEGEFPYCGDAVCLFEEDCATCPQDCGACPFCGDGDCGDDEDCVGCPDDCGPCDTDCCEVHGGQGCDDGDCTDIVCEADPYCCNNNWDNICANEAVAWCPVCGGNVPVCGDGECGSGESCGNCPADCGVCPPECGDGECNGDENCATCSDDCGACCGNDVCDAELGENCVSCEGDCGPCEGDCCESNGSAGCTTPSCQDLVCAQDDFCCDNTWDNLCAGAAEELCVGCMDVGNCCATDHGTGCENQAVQDCVCALDDWCCDNEWDWICVGKAEVDCGANCDLASFCGDDSCGDGEDCVTCEADCDPCCGNGVCDTDLGEDCATCEADCDCPVAATCADRCEDDYNAALPCQCDNLCFGADDCCQDVCEECGGSFAEDCDAITDTCKFRCGEYDGSKDCQCDSICFSEDDCCGDVCEFCDADYPQECP